MAAAGHNWWAAELAGSPGSGAWPSVDGDVLWRKFACLSGNCCCMAIALLDYFIFYATSEVSALNDGG